MKKAKSNASWSRLTLKQRETLDRWLFDENLSYAKVLTKAESELGYKGSQTSLRRYYERRQQERLVTDVRDVGRDVAEIQGLQVDPHAARKASMQVLAVFLFRALRENPNALKELTPVVRAMLQNDFNENFRELKDHDLRLREEAMAFAKEKYRADTTEQALEALPELMELAQARKDPATKEYESAIRLNRVIRAMFGPGHDVHPETAQEAAEMLAAKREREARQAAEREAAAERKRIRDEIGGAQPPTPSSQYYQEYVAAKAEREAEELAREKAFQENQAQASLEEQAAQEELRKQREAEALQAEQAEKEKRRKYWEVRTKFEEIKVLCGWEQLKRPPGWGDMEGWKDAPFEWDDDDAYLEWGE